MDPCKKKELNPRKNLELHGRVRKNIFDLRKPMNPHTHVTHTQELVNVSMTQNDPNPNSNPTFLF